MDTRNELLTPLATDEVLTRAETRVASGYVTGRIGKEIADVCGISYTTVVKHTQNIYDKTGIRRSTNALVAWFLGKNAGLDLREFERRLGAAFLLALLSVQMLGDPAGDSFVRRPGPRRIEARRARRGRRREDEIDIMDYMNS